MFVLGLKIALTGVVLLLTMSAVCAHVDGKAYKFAYAGMACCAVISVLGALVAIWGMFP